MGGLFLRLLLRLDSAAPLTTLMGDKLPPMNYANVLIRCCSLLGLAVAATELSRELIFLDRLIVLAVVAFLWWIICKKTPLTKKA